MASELRDELFKAKMRKLEADSTRILNEHMLVQTNETRARLEANVVLKSSLVTQLQHLNHSLITDGEVKRQLHLFRGVTVDSVDLLERNFRNFNIDKMRKIQKMRDKASHTLSRFPSESRQQLQEEKKALLFTKLRAVRDQHTKDSDRTTKEILEAQQKIEETRARLAVMDKEAVERRELCAAQMKEIEEDKAILLEKTRQEKEMSEQLTEKNLAIVKIKEMIPPEELEKEAQRKFEELEAKVAETQKLVASVSSKLTNLIKEHAESHAAAKLKKQELEDVVINEDTNIELQLTDARGALQHAQLLHKGARQRLEVTRRKLHQEQSGKSVEEIKKGLSDRESDRKEKLETAKIELEKLNAQNEEMIKEDAEKVSSTDAVDEKMAALSKKEAELRKELKRVKKQLAQNAAACTSSSQICEKLEAEAAKLKDDNKRHQNKILAFTQMATPAKKRELTTDALDITLSRASSGDSDVTSAPLDVDGIDAFSPETLKMKRGREQLSSFGYSDESGAEENPLLNDSLLGDIDTGDESDENNYGDYFDDFSDYCEADDENGTGNVNDRKVDEDDSLFNLDDLLESPRKDREEDFASDVNSSRDDGRFPRDIFLNESPHQELPRAHSPPANLTEDEAEDSVLESDVSMQSIWD